MGLLRSFLKDQRGAAAAEMALIVPAALVVMFTTFEGAYFMICEHQVVKGVREASRYVSRLDLSQFTCPAGTFGGATATVQNLARTGQLTGGTARVPGWVDSHVTVTITCASGQGGIYAANGGYAPKARVTALVPYPAIMRTLGFTQSTLTLRASSESPVMGL
jgi:Flp pilus assembly protein TadG